MTDSADAADLSVNQHTHRAPGANENSQRGNILYRLSNNVYNFFDNRVTWFRKSIVEPNQKDYNWYHRSFRRVPTIDKCYTDDVICIYEADQQFVRDRLVDNEILNILRYRMDDCVREEYPDFAPRCVLLKEAYDQASADWFSRYGDMGAGYNVETAYMKQKHRMLWERRHGPIGTGMKTEETVSAHSE